MSYTAIKVENLGKRYRIGQYVGYKTLRESLTNAFAAPFRRLSPAHRELSAKGHSPSATSYDPSSDSQQLSAKGDSPSAMSYELTRHELNHIWALKDVSFEVKQGEAIGIIGRNGSGKSTLLKILSRITAPTEGCAEIRGRVGSLLEVGTGFHPELTGRENIHLNGAVLGMKKAEVDRKFDEIVAFAEIEKFLDTPVKRYSSGMYVRLAFAVAAHLETEVLIVDEVLAVGDAQFQKKCLGKMGDVTKEGRTVLFVSHNMRAVKSLCGSALLLGAGSVIGKGQVQSVIDSYLTSTGLRSSLKVFPLESGDIVVNGFDICQNDITVDDIDGTMPFKIKIAFELLRDLDLFRIGIYLRSMLGDTILRSFSGDWNPQAESLQQGSYEACLDFPGKLLAPGSYVVQLHASRYGLVDYLTKFNIERSIIISSPLDFNLAHVGEPLGSMILMKNKWEVRRVVSTNKRKSDISRHDF